MAKAKGKRRRAGAASSPPGLPPAPGPSREPAGWRILPGAALLFVLVLVAFHPALECGFIWDDPQYVVDNPHLRTAGGLSHIWGLSLDPETHRPRCDTPQYYPLVFTSFWLEYQHSGLKASVYHADNLLLHALAAVFLWLLLRRLGVPGAWLAAAIFALHPVTVESAAWITERKNVLSLVFYLGAFLAYLKFALPRGAPPGVTADEAPRVERKAYGAALFLFLCALLSKTVTATFPAAVLLVLWWKKGRLALRDVKPLVPFFLLGAAFGLLTAFLETTHVGAQGDEWSLTLLERFLLAGCIPWFYTWKLLWPAQLIFIYPRWRIDAGAPLQYVPPLALAGAILALWLLRKRWGRGPLAAVLFFLGSLFPALGFFNVFPMRFSFVADHFQYLACIGPIALAAAVAARGARRLRAPAWAGRAAAAALLLALGVLTFRLVPIYQDQTTLWRDVLAKNPAAWIAHNNLGEILFAQGKTDEAMQQSQEALRLKPDLPEAHGNLANALYGKGEYEEAVAHYHELLRLDPDNVIARNNLAYALQKLGRLKEAQERCEEALALQPGSVKTHFILAEILGSQGRNEEAAAQYAEVVRLDPSQFEAEYRLGVLLQVMGKREEAREHFQRALPRARLSGSGAIAADIEARLAQ